MDALSAGAIQDALMELVDEGERHLLIDLSGVVFLSSAGIRALMIVGKQLHGSSGGLVLSGASDQVASVIETAGLTTLFTLVRDPAELTGASGTEEEAEPGTAVTGEGIAMRVSRNGVEAGRLRIIGDYRPLARAGYREPEVQSEPLSAGLYAAGVAAAGESFEDYSRLFGEALVMDGNFYVQPGVSNPRVDYVLREWSGSLGGLRFLHGFAFSGGFACHVQFEDQDVPIDLETLRRAMCKLSEAQLLGVVMVAESRGHWGMALRRSPMEGALADGEGQIFDAEHFADWLDFPVEPGEPGLLLAATGLMARDRDRLPARVAELFPEQSNLHLHAVVMQKGHLSRRVDDFEQELNRVLSHQLPEQVCHLLPATTLRAGLLGIIELEV